MGGYENNPILLDSVSRDFNFGLYELDYSVFDAHIEGAVKICPTFGNAGIKSTICGPESFTPDHKPLMVQINCDICFRLIMIDSLGLACLSRLGAWSTLVRTFPQLWLQLCWDDAWGGLCKAIGELDYSQSTRTSYVPLWRQTFYSEAEESLRLGGWTKPWKLREEL